MVFEVRKQSIAWMEQRLQILLEIFSLSMEDKMGDIAFGHTTNYR